MLNQPLKTMLGLLRLIRASTGDVEGRVRVQKEAFLVAMKREDLFEPSDFVYHHHGPYSRSLSDSLHSVVSLGLVEEVRENFADNIVRYKYRLTEEGGDLLTSVEDEEDNEMSGWVRAMEQCHWRALELAATILFLQRAGDAPTRIDAMRQALDLKPACRNYTGDAEAVLTKLEL